jgi:hypothetical protein
MRVHEQAGTTRAKTPTSSDAECLTASPRHSELEDQKLVNQVVAELNMLCKSATFDFALSVGNLIVAKFYQGDVNAWRSRGPKDASFRTLSRHPDLPMSPSSLYRCVATYEVCQRIGIISWKHVSTSHIRVILPVPHEEQSRLLKAAEANRWPVGRLVRPAGSSFRSGAPKLTGFKEGERSGVDNQLDRTSRSWDASDEA